MVDHAHIAPILSTTVHGFTGCFNVGEVALLLPTGTKWPISYKQRS